MNYLVTNYKDEYYITNTRLDGKDSYFHIYKMKDCVTTKSVNYNGSLVREYSFYETVFIKYNEKVKLVLADGDYRINNSLVANPSTSSFSTSSGTFTYISTYVSLQKRLLRNIREFLCEECNNSKFSNGCIPIELMNYLKYQGLLNELLTYNFLVRKPFPNENGCDKNCVYNNTLNILLELYKCAIIPAMTKQSNSECLTGKIDFNLYLFKQYLSIYYTIFYIEEYTLFGLDTESIDYINNKYQYDKVKVCTGNIGLNFDFVFDIYEEQTQLCNIDPEVDNGTITVIDASSDNRATNYYFTASDFTTNYFDPSNHNALYVKIISLPTKGTLYLNTSQNPMDVVTVNKIISLTSISNLYYEVYVTQNSANWDGFKFQIINSGNRYSNIANIKIKTQIIQSTVTIGNNTIEELNRKNYVFDILDFTTNTTPPYYSDSENPLARIRIDVLYLEVGSLLRLNGVDITAGQIIPVSAIEAKQLVYTAPDTDAQAISEFIWSGSDTVSGDNFVN